MHTCSDKAPLLPGVKPVLELLLSNPSRIDLVYCKKGLRSREALETQRLCRQHGLRFSLVDQLVLDRLCRDDKGRKAVAHQGLVARLAMTAFCGLDHLLSTVTEAPLPLLLALDQVQDPGNVGTLCRTLYTLGGAGLVLPLHNSALLGPAAHKAAAGALEHLPAARVTNLGHALDQAEEAGLAIYGTGVAGKTAAAGTLNAFTEPLRLPAVLVLGNEQKGLRPGVTKRCAHLLHIPQARPLDSFNVAQAGAIILGLAAAAQARAVDV